MRFLFVVGLVVACGSSSERAGGGHLGEAGAPAEDGGQAGSPAEAGAPSAGGTSAGGSSGSGPVELDACAPLSYLAACGSFGCGPHDDGCGSSIDCGGCIPEPVGSRFGKQCLEGQCEAVLLGAAYVRDATRDAECAALDTAHLEAWTGESGWPLVLGSCVRLDPSSVATWCCTPTAQCARGYNAGCVDPARSSYVTNCESAPGCDQVVAQGRLTGAWCCP